MTKTKKSNNRKFAEQDFQCQDCFKKVNLKQAEQQERHGCKRCGSTDVDLAR